MANGDPLTFHKVTALPATPVENGIYFVRNGDRMQIVVTADDGTPVPLEVPGSAAFIQSFGLSSEWVVNHNYGHRPAAVTVLSPGGVEVEASIVHTSDNQFVVQLNPPMAGQVVVS